MKIYYSETSMPRSTSSRFGKMTGKAEARADLVLDALHHHSLDAYSHHFKAQKAESEHQAKKFAFHKGMVQHHHERVQDLNKKLDTMSNRGGPSPVASHINKALEAKEKDPDGVLRSAIMHTSPLTKYHHGNTKVLAEGSAHSHLRELGEE